MSNTSVTPSKKNAQSHLAKPNNDILDELDRKKMISDAAYFRAEHRGFKVGESLADWLAAEAEIDAAFKSH